ncbi:hypothetical protein CDIK_1501 [Cucumispora dikerogammari]|nr:hypothetical protein CDIK_1501 [Cucumispora dikerogammari]
MITIAFAKMFFSRTIDNINLSCITISNLKSESIPFEKLIKSADLTMMEDIHGNRLKNQNLLNETKYVKLDSSFPLCNIAKNGLLHSMFIMVPLFEIKTSSIEKISVSFFENLLLLNCIYQNFERDTGHEYIYRFSTISDFRLVKYFTFNNIEIGVEKKQQVSPGYLFFENSFTGKYYLYLAVFIDEKDAEACPSSQTYRNLYYEYVNTGLITESAKTSFFELSLDLNIIKDRIFIATHLESCISSHPLIYKLIPAIENGDISVLLNSTLTIRLQAAIEEEKLVFKIHRNFEKKELEEMYIKVEEDNHFIEYLKPPRFQSSKLS